MGSNEPPGTQSQGDTIDLDAEAHLKLPLLMELLLMVLLKLLELVLQPLELLVHPSLKAGAGAGKRKMPCHEEALMTKLTDAIWGFAAAVTELAHSEAAPGIY